MDIWQFANTLDQIDGNRIENIPEPEDLPSGDVKKFSSRLALLEHKESKKCPHARRSKRHQTA